MEANLKDSAMPLHSAPQQENDWIQRCPLPHPACKHLQDKDLTPSHLPWNGCLESTRPYSKAALHHPCVWTVPLKPSVLCSRGAQTLPWWKMLLMWPWAGLLSSSEAAAVWCTGCCWPFYHSWILNFITWRRYLAFPACELFDVAAIAGVVTGTVHQASPSGRTYGERKHISCLLLIQQRIFLFFLSSWRIQLCQRYWAFHICCCWMRSGCPVQHTCLLENNINALLIPIKKLPFLPGEPIREGSFRGGERDFSAWNPLQALKLHSMYCY